LFLRPKDIFVEDSKEEDRAMNLNQGELEKEELQYFSYRLKIYQSQH
jgi:hypothetical protein